jgi:cytochrome bd-type quinol oxidase subunit 2
MLKDDLDDITAEESLADVYRNVTSRIPTRRAYVVVPIVVAALVLVSGLLSKDIDLGARVRDWATTIFGFASSVLGILLAGFAIFSTVSTSSLVGHLVQHKEPTSGLSYLKYVTGHFMIVFVSYTAYLAFYAVVMLFGWSGSPVARIVEWLGVAKPGASLMMAIVGAFFVHLIIVLQSFVFRAVSGRLRYELIRCPG